MKKLPNFGEETITFSMSQPQAKLACAVIHLVCDMAQPDSSINISSIQDLRSELDKSLKRMISSSLPDHYSDNVKQLTSDLEALIQPVIDGYTDAQMKHQDLFAKEVNSLAKKLHPDVFVLPNGRKLQLSDAHGETNF